MTLNLEYFNVVKAKWWTKKTETVDISVWNSKIKQISSEWIDNDFDFLMSVLKIQRKIDVVWLEPLW